MNVVGIIPARMASSRFPGKPLVKIIGMEMLGHVYHRAKISQTLKDVYIATCDEEIATYSKSIGAKVVMTSDKHERATERVAEAVDKMKIRPDGVIMLQGDEPTIQPETIDTAVTMLMNDSSIDVLNLITKIKSLSEFNNPNTVKVVRNKNGNAMYFSREPIPSAAKFSGSFNMFKQLGVILFKTDVLEKYIKMDSSELEIIESVDMNRYLENQIDIKLMPVEGHFFGVDVVEDLQGVENVLKNDPLCLVYMESGRIGHE